MNREELRKKFEDQYGTGAEAIRFYFSPGRINLIGEHIDYNGGFVLPAALTLGITGLTRLRADRKVRFSSLNLPTAVEIDLDKPIENRAEFGWANYPIGMLAFLKKEGRTLRGADVLFSSNLPDGAGLSSSAALEVLTGYMFLCESGAREIDRVWLSKLSQQVENQFVGVNCGIMDQFSVANGKANHAMLLNCQTLECSQIPLQLGQYSLVIMNTRKRRELAESKYNQRRSECEKALAILRRHRPIHTLCEATLEEIETYIHDNVLKSRAKHVVSENTRVLESKRALEHGDLHWFGQLLNDSHQSLRYNYEVTGMELDEITEAANAHPACIGARMTGAGFGGCALALVETNQTPDFEKFVSQRYQLSANLVPQFYVSQIGDGVKLIG